MTLPADKDIDEAASSADAGDAADLSEQDSATARTNASATTTTLPPIGTPFVIGQVLEIEGISEIVGDGTITVELATEPDRIQIDIDGSVPVVDGRTCEFCMGRLELRPQAVVATLLFGDHEAQGTSVQMTVGLEGGMFPDEDTAFIVAGDDGAVLEKEGAGFRLVDGSAWLVTDRSLIDAGDETTPALTGEVVVAPIDEAGFVDEFDGSLSGGWNWVRPDPSRHRLDDPPGWLRITAQNQFPPTNLLLREAPDGSFEMTTAVRFAPEENFQFAGLIIVDEDETKFSQLGRAFCGVEGCIGDGIYFDNWQDGAQLGGGLAELAGDPEVIHLRLTADGNEYTAGFSTDGENWTTVGTYARDFTTRRIGLVAHQAATEITAEFAYFTLTEFESDTVERQGVQYVATAFEAGDFSSDVWLSTDLLAWERVPTGLGVALMNVDWNGHDWIAVGQGTIATSADARSWTLRQDMGELTDVLRFHGAAWNGSQWMVVGDLQILANPTSDWTGETFGAGEMGMFLFAVASNGEQSIAVGNGWQILSYEAPTGTAFTPRHGAPQQSEGESLDDILWDVAWGDGVWVAVGEDGRVLVSRDGIGWSDTDSGTNEVLRSVAHNGATWMAASGLGNLFTSTDGFTWQRTAGRPNTNEITDITWDGCQWVATGDGVHTSPDGGSWVRHDVDVVITGIAVAYDEPCNSGGEA